MRRTCLICLKRGLPKDRTVVRRSTVNRKYYVLCLKCDQTLEDAAMREIQRGCRRRGY
jgi:hypothetical protein